MDEDVIRNIVRQKRRRRYRRVLVVVGAILALLLATLTVYRIILSHKVAAELARIRAQGYPVTLEELNAWYPEPPPGQNAADVYAAAFALYGTKAIPDYYSLWKNTGSMPPRGEALSPDAKAAMEEFKSQLTILSDKQKRPVLTQSERYLVKNETFFVNRSG